MQVVERIAAVAVFDLKWQLKSQYSDFILKILF